MANYKLGGFGFLDMRYIPGSYGWFEIRSFWF